MNKKRILNVLGIVFVSLSFAFLTSCDKDDTKAPENVVTLNMLDELNGQTKLGGSDVYINKANNFRANYNFISDIGYAAGIGAVRGPRLSNLVKETAVTPGHIYQIFDNRTIYEFPSGERAVQIDAAYYQLYVVSPITNNDKTTGAVIQYFSEFPDKKGLPDYEYKLGEVKSYGDKVELSLPKGAECYWDSNMENFFNITTNGGKLQITLIQIPHYNSGLFGGYTVYIRVGNVFTEVYVVLLRE